MKLSCWKMRRIKVVTLLGIKEGSCTSTRGKQRCSCNNSPMMALMLKPEMVKRPQTVNGPIWTQDRKERHGVRGLLPPRLVQAPPPPPATTVPAARHQCRRSCLGEVGGGRLGENEDKVADAEVWSLTMRHFSSWAQPFSGNQKYPSPLRHSLGTCLYHLEKLLQQHFS